MKQLFAHTKYMVAVLLITGMATSCSSSKKSSAGHTLPALQPEPESKTGKIKDPVMYEKKIRSKYAAYINIPQQSIQNIGLFVFIDKWLYTPYKYGGTTQQGVDCSGFVQRVLSDVYGYKIARKSSQQFFNENTAKFSNAHLPEEGDLLFFITTDNSKAITHMGLYVGNRMFVHASSSLGVSIASLDNSYWKPRYTAAGKVIEERK
jgi:hypothetical protein